MMNEEYKRLIESAKSRKKDLKKFLERLKKSAPGDLDAVTNRYHEEAFETIDCLQCANCCRTTGPLLRHRDVEELARHFRMRPAAFTEKYLRVDEDNDYVFKSMPCPFLGADHYCAVYESRPGACRDYPHTSQRDIRGKLDITYHNTMICPAVAVVVEKLREHYS